jgi:hypothetical protein
MSRYSVSPELLFNRPWRAGHPFRPHCGRLRRWCIMLLLLVLCLAIGGYDYLTDSGRVRSMAESYLTRLVGGRVEVGAARLSIFEGLRLENVRVHVDRTGDEPDSVIFNAQTIVVLYNPRSMLAGQLEATQIIAERPHVLLAVNEADNTWNYHRLGSVRNKRPRPVFPSQQRAVVLPEILLRNARLELAEVRDGKLFERGEMALDGQVLPSADGEHCSFEMQSRGTQGIGPYVTGVVDTTHGGFDANLRNFEFGEDWDFGHDVQKMLPAAVRDWWQRHQLAGRVDIPVVRYTPASNDSGPHFRVEMLLRPVTMAVGPEEWGGEESHKSGPATAPSALTPTGAAVMPATVPASVAGAAAGPLPQTALASTTVASTTGPAAGVAAAKTIELRQVSGLLVFTEKGIEVSDMTGRVEDNGVRVNGSYSGYGPDAPFTLRISSLESENIFLPESPRYVDSLPKAVRDLYNAIRPQGTARVDVQLDRATPGALPVARGVVDVVNGRFAFDKFPYPLREAKGQIAFGPDEHDEYESVRIMNLRGRGVENGPNKDSYVTIDGSVGPLVPGEEPATEVRVSGEAVSSEPALARAFPPPVREAMRLLGANGPQYPSYFGDFVTRVHRNRGKKERWTFDTDVAVNDAAGALTGFAYPLRHIRGNLKVRDGYVDIEHMQSERDGASVVVDGRVAWGAAFDDRFTVDLTARPGGRPIQTVVHVLVHRAPIDADLINAIPEDKRGWMKALGVKGVLDVDGELSQQPPIQGGKPPASVEEAMAQNPLTFNLKMKLADGELTPAGSKFSVKSAIAEMTLIPDALHIESASARRGTAAITLWGDIAWPNGEPTLAIHSQAVGLLLDQDLHDLLPPEARVNWDALRPAGTVDVDIAYRTTATTATAAPAGAAQTQPAAKKPSLHIGLQPRELSIKPVGLPYQLDGLKGALSINDEHLNIAGVTARHGNAGFTLAGTGELGDKTTFDLKLSAKNLIINPALRDAMPEPVQNIIDGLKLHGPCDLNFSRLVYRSGLTSAATAPAGAAVAAAPTTGPFAASAKASAMGTSLDFTLAATLHDGGLDVGVPLDEVNGTLNLDMKLRDGALAAIGGKFDVDSLSMAGRALQNFSAELNRSEDGNGLKIGRMQADLAGGQMAGEIDLLFPADGPSRYTLNLIVRDADVRELARETDPTIQGNLTASLSLEGAWGDAVSRRGRGDVVVTGKEMYRIPVILGLLQVTNLALPVAQPFHRGTVRYTLDGQRVNFDQIELRSDTMLMSGSGHLDFGSKQVRMSFTTDNPSGLQLPILNDLLKGARNELFKINVKGTITQPKVETSVMGTFTTTVDEVLKGDEGK